MASFVWEDFKSPNEQSLSGFFAELVSEHSMSLQVKMCRLRGYEEEADGGPYLERERDLFCQIVKSDLGSL